MILDGILDGKNTSLGNGAILAIVSIILVFLILALIILITSGVNKLISLKNERAPKVEENKISSCNKADENDEDMMVACLVASIDYQNEIKSNVRVVNVKEIK